MMIIYYLITLLFNLIDSKRLIDTINLSQYNLNNLNLIKESIYVGGENILIKLNTKDLSITNRIEYGPVYDSYECKYYPKEEDDCSKKKELMNNYNKLIVPLNETHLLTCWTSYQGICDVRLIDDLTKLVYNTTIPIVNNDPFNSSIALVTQDMLLVANTYNNLGKEQIPAIAGRSLDTLLIKSTDYGLKSTRSSIEFMSRFIKSFIVSYVYSFKQDNFNYFLTVQQSDAYFQLNNNNQLQTKIARLCSNDQSLIRSYTETPIQCSTFNILIHMTKFKSQNSKSNDDNTYLIGLFENSSTRKQAICVYSLKQINYVINDNIKSCLTGSGSIQRGLSFIKPDQRCTRNLNLVFDDDVNWCSSSIIENSLFPIGGKIAIKTKSIFELNENITFNHLNIFNDSLSNINLILLSNENNLIQFHKVTFNRRKNGLNLVKYDEIQLDTLNQELLITKPRTNLEIDYKNYKLYLIHKNYLYSIKLNELEPSFDCNKLDCTSCTNHPNCGWCESKQKCVLKQDSFRECPFSDLTNKCPTNKTNCTLFDSCNSCQQSNECNWCDNRCDVKSSKCSSTGQCPYFDVFTSKLLIPYLDSKIQTSSIQFYLNNQLNHDYDCLIDNLNITAKYQRLNETYSNCILILHQDNPLITLLKQNQGIFETKLKLFNRKLNFMVNSINSNSKLIFYKCDLMALDDTCDSCKAIDSQYSCSYCDSKCKFSIDSKSCETKCSNNIEVLSVKPNKIPLNSGSLVEIDLISSYLTENSIRSIRICDQECDLKKFIKYFDGKKQKLQCKAQAYVKKSSCKIEIFIDNGELLIIDNKNFAIEYVDPTLNDIKPTQVIQSSRGVQLTIYGNDLDSGLIQQVQIIDPNDSQIVFCNVISLASNLIKCEINETFQSIGKKNFKLIYDTTTQSALNYMQAINVNSNPILNSINKNEALVTGGTKFQLSGYNFDSVQKIYCFTTVGDAFHSELVPVLKRISNEKLLFRFPNIDLITDSKIQARIGFKFDGFTKILDDYQITYNPNPFKTQPDDFKIEYIDKISLENDATSQILIIYFRDQIKNEKLKDDFEIYLRISDSIYCECEQQFWFNETYLTCKLSSMEQCSRLTNQSVEQQPQIRTFIGFWEIKQNPLFSVALRQMLDHVNVDSNTHTSNFYSNLTLANRIIIICIVISLILLVIIVLVYYINKYYKFKSNFSKEKFNDTTQRLASFNSNDYQIRKIENTNINRYELDLKLKLEYLNELNYDLIYQGVPLWQYKNYLLNFLFGSPLRANLTSQQTPTSTNSTSSSSTTSTTTRTSLFYATIKSQIKPGQNVNEAMNLFNQLLHNKVFLNIFIQTCDANENNLFNMNDRVQFSSILCLLLKDNLSYLYSILKSQLSDYINTINDLQSNKARLLFRQSNTIIEFLVSKFLTMFMYQFVKDNCSIELYRLFKILKHQIESGPVDYIANKAYNCINENYILKVSALNYSELNLNFINSCDMSRIYKFKVLDCDTIFQAKEKILDCLYKNSAYSLRPNINDIDIEFRISNNPQDSNHQQQEKILVYNYSSIILKEYDSNRKLLTIRDYCLFDDAYVYLIFKTNHFYEGTYTLPNVPNQHENNYHLINQNDTSKLTISTSTLATSRMYENHLNRLVKTKCQLEPYLDSLFETIFKNTSNLPPVIKHLFDFIDQELKNKFPQQQTTNDMIELGRLWKTNSYFLRFWINLIKNPQYLFDINKTPLIDASLTSIAQVFMDSCSMNDQLLDKDASTNKLLFSNDVKRYKCLVDSFYNEIQTSPSISDHELHYYFNEYSKVQPNDMNQVQLLLDLYDYYEKFEKKINETLGQQQCSILLPVHHKLVQIKELLAYSNQSDNNCV